ncbi:hypothetical protein L0244_37275 [bacterium]|nr:hypothetical protein [bacterium]
MGSQIKSRAIQNDRGIASNLIDAFSRLQDSEQVALRILNQEIDNTLKKMNDVVNQGPLAAIRG